MIDSKQYNRLHTANILYEFLQISCLTESIMAAAVYIVHMMQSELCIMCTSCFWMYVA